MASLTFRQVLPHPATVDADALGEYLALDHKSAQDRPYTLANFVTSADGHVTVQGRSGALGDDGDRAMFRGLREHVDAVVAGTATLRTENYGRILPDPARRQRRLTAGRSAEPLACVFSLSGNLPLEIPLFSESEARIVIFAPTAPSLKSIEAETAFEPIDPADQHPLRTAMRKLRDGYGVNTLLCEGGPKLFGALLREGLVDELFLTVAPKLAGPFGGPAVAAGPPLDELTPLEIRALLTREGSLFVRYRVR